MAKKRRRSFIVLDDDYRFIQAYKVRMNGEGDTASNATNSDALHDILRRYAEMVKTKPQKAPAALQTSVA